MLIQGSYSTNRLNILVEKYNSLIDNGINTGEILIIVLNPVQKKLFIEECKKNIQDISESKLKIYTPYGLCYNSLNDNSDFINKIIKANDSSKINLCGLEVSQFIFKHCISEADFKDYISKINLLHQLFRRYSFTVHNCFSADEIKQKSLILKESFYEDAQKAINDYKQKTIEYRSFDYLRQLAVFPIIYKNTNYFDGIKYLIVNDADEMSYVIWQFIEYLTYRIKDVFIAYDKNGSSRCGYLCAYKSGVFDYKKKFKTNEIILEEKSYFSDIAESFFKNIKNGVKTRTKNIEHKMFSVRLDMLGSILQKAEELISSGIEPDEIAIISPQIDDVFIKTLCENNRNIKIQIISGNEKLADIKIIRHILIILKLASGINIPSYALKSILIDLLKIPFKKSFEIIKDYEKTKVLKKFVFDDNLYNARYIKLYNLLESLKKTKNSLSEKIDIIYKNINFENNNDNISKYNFLLKEAKSFEDAFAEREEDIVKEFIVQIDNSVISENPVDSFNIENKAVIVATPQKIIDYCIKTKYQIWADISSNEWFKSDTGTLYNAWVFNRDWQKSSYNIEDNIENTRDKSARIIRKVMLCAKKEVIFYSSLYDNTGNENFGGLSDFIETCEEKKKQDKIVPREDQKPVLDYKSGKMGIMAVPGAGKTTILLALIVNLMQNGVKAENIFVLTYMESAAKNFKERIKQIIPDSDNLPNISTIHGLALRIIKENGNYIKAGLDENFEICDDNTKERIIKELFYKLKINEEKYDNYLRCISVVKLSENSCILHSKYPDIEEFYKFLKEYNKALKQNNLIDYDDMLKFAVNILNEDSSVAEYYQNLCRYIIEDEAQDSSEIQQKLINILAFKHKNIVRCGDINQAITSTFTNSNTEGFRKFIQSNKKVEMVSSQRCSAPIYSFANKIIESAQKDAEKNNAFYPIKIQGTSNNPLTTKQPEFLCFENDKEEKYFILNKVKEIIKKSPQVSIAVLLRLNSQVNEYNEFFISNGIQTSVRTDCLIQRKIYNYIFAVLSIIEKPENNNIIKILAELYAEKYVNEDKDSIKNYINSLKKPFIYIDPDELNSELLIQLYWDIDYWLNNSNKPVEEMALQAGLYYSVNSSDKSNTYLISTLIKRLKNSNDENNENLLNRLEYYSSKPLSSYKFFEEETTGEKENPLQIMTMHKSKGDEFDIVFIPQLNEDNYPLNINTIKLKGASHFVQAIKNDIEKCGIKSPDELKEDQIKETLRLLYVGVTRAKKELYMTNAKKYKNRKETKSVDFIRNLLTT